jgi:preprotein translocase subunit SecB
MAMTNGGPPPEGAANAPDQTAPSLNVLAQYVKDLSFENPNAPRSLSQQPGQQQPGQQQPGQQQPGQQQQQPPKINIQINVNAKPLADNDFEVELKIEGRAELPTTFLFGFDLLYAGIFRIQNVPQENVHALIMIECPRLLFPFAREIIATAVRNGGFAPLLLDPVDFVALYQQRVAQEQAKAAATPTTA